MKPALQEILEQAYSAISKKYGNKQPLQLLHITAPGRTDDFEKTLTPGANSHKGLHVFLY